MSARTRLDPETTTVHEAIGRLPGAGAVFRRYGLDTCCGGELPISVAARHHGVDLGRLLDALEGAGAGPGTGADVGASGGAASGSAD